MIRTARDVFSFITFITFIALWVIDVWSSDEVFLGRVWLTWVAVLVFPTVALWLAEDILEDE